MASLRASRSPKKTDGHNSALKSKTCLSVSPQKTRSRSRSQQRGLPPTMRCVKFNPETVETSFGGTQSTGYIQENKNLPDVKINFSSCLTTDDTVASPPRKPISVKDAVSKFNSVNHQKGMKTFQSSTLDTPSEKNAKINRDVSTERNSKYRAKSPARTLKVTPSVSVNSLKKDQHDKQNTKKAGVVCTGTPEPTPSSLSTAKTTGSSTTLSTPKPNSSSTTLSTPKPNSSSTTLSTPKPNSSTTRSSTPKPNSSSTTLSTPKPNSSSTTLSTPKPNSSSTSSTPKPNGSCTAATMLNAQRSSTTCTTLTTPRGTSGRKSAVSTSRDDQKKACEQLSVNKVSAGLCKSSPLASAPNMTPSKTSSSKVSDLKQKAQVQVTHAEDKRRKSDSKADRLSGLSQSHSTKITVTPVKTPVKSKLTQREPAPPDKKIDQFLVPDSNQITPLKTQMSRAFLKNQSGTPECFNPVTFETPVKRRSLDQEDSSIDFDEYDNSVTVAVRVRPFSSRELLEEGLKCCISMLDNETVVSSDKCDLQHFRYDYSFWSFDKIGGVYANQEHVYEALAQPMLCKAFEGYNTCLFAYGQTGSGKSYSIMGQEQTDPGIIPRFCEELFSRADGMSDKVNVELSFFEIYKEKIHDLLESSKDKTGKRPNLKVREHPSWGPYVEGLSSYVANSYDDVKGWLNVGNKYRATAATGMNDRSSRSHAVFTMVLTQTKCDIIEEQEHEHTITSKINLVDLAGSERQSVAKTSGDRLREGASINTSLMILGKVISVLCESCQSNPAKKKKVFIPYRESVLTWLLKESLGGNSKTAMLATISPANVHLEETLSTLRYAKQARSIMNTARVNEDPKARIIRELRAEIEKLRDNGMCVNDSNDDLIENSLAEIKALKEKLSMKDVEMEAIAKTWQEKLKQSEQRKLEESQLLERSGIAFKLDEKLPNLVNLNEDPQLAGTLLYILREGETRVGRVADDTAQHQIQLKGVLIAEKHCMIRNQNNEKVSIEPVGDAQTYINGNAISKMTRLHHGDRVILGGDHYFRYTHPVEAQTQPSRVSGGKTLKDFVFAQQELMAVQDARLAAELQDARKRHEQQLEKELERQRNQADKQLSHQRSQYEDRLQQLQRQLKQQFLSKQETDEQIEKLASQNMVLEQEFLSEKKRLELESEEAKTLQPRKAALASLLRGLQKRDENVREEVKNLKEEHCQYTDTQFQGSLVKQDFRVVLMLQEANKITQLLGLPVFFERALPRKPDTASQSHIFIQVKNTDKALTTVWPLEKFESRLVDMRDVYQRSDSLSCTYDDLFFDPEDVWEKDEWLKTTCSPFRTKGSSITKDLFMSKKTCKITDSSNKENTGQVNTGNLFDDSHTGLTGDESKQCDMDTDLVDFSCLSKEPSGWDVASTSDRILCVCDKIKSAIASMLDAFNRSNGVGHNTFNRVNSQAAREGLHILHSNIPHLVTIINMWSTQLLPLETILVNNLYSTAGSVTAHMKKQVLLFLEAYVNEEDSDVQESSSKAAEDIFTLLRVTGEVSILTEDKISCLTSHHNLRHDTKQSFLSGCDVGVDKTLHRILHDVDRWQSDLTRAVNDAGLQAHKTDVSHNALLIIASVKVILQNLQEMQFDPETSLMETDTEVKTEEYYSEYSSRCLLTMTTCSQLAVTVRSLAKVCQLYVSDEEGGSLQQVTRHAEVVQKASCKAVSSLHSTQIQRLNVSVKDLQLAVKAIRKLCGKSLRQSTTT